MKNRSMPDPAVLLIIFNRPLTTQKVFDAIRLAKPSCLYIAADAPRRDNVSDEENCKAARAVTELIDWSCQVKRLYQEQNLGCRMGVQTALNWFFDQEEMGIILEDDCVPGESFFPFCSEMLIRFKDDKRIISVNGCNLGYKLNNGDSYTFSRFMNMWGWATWKRSAEKIDYDLLDWKTEKHSTFAMYKQLRQNIFDTDINWYKYWKHKFDCVILNKIDTWDWQWIWHQTSHRQLSIVPAVNLVTNIGFHDQATHTLAPDNPAANIPARPLSQPFLHPARIKPDLTYEEKYVKWVWCYHKRTPFYKYLVNKLA